MPKVGIGCISYLRPKHLTLWHEQVLKYAPKEYELSIYIDNPRRGVAYGKNQNLKYLKDCDYVFLFDSDCFPIRKLWADWFIQKHIETGQHHFLYLKETATIKKVGHDNSINIYNNCGGCFMFLTRKCIETIGAFDEAYGFFGYEHADYTRRIFNAGLNSMGEYLCPDRAREFIYSLDYDNYLHYNKELGHLPSISVGDRIDCLSKASVVWNLSDSDNKKYLPL